MTTLRAHLIANELRNEVNSNISELFNWCEDPNKQSVDIDNPCPTVMLNEMHDKIIQSLMDKRLYFDDEHRYETVEQVLRDTNPSVIDEINRRVKVNITKKKIGEFVESQRKEYRKGFLYGLKSFFFPTRKDFMDREIYSQATMRVLDEARIFDLVEDTVISNARVYPRYLLYYVDDSLRVVHAYSMQLGIVAIIAFAIISIYAITMVYGYHMGLDMNSVLDVGLARYSGYFQAKGLANAVKPM